MPAQSLLDEARKAWSYTRRSVIAELENLPADRFDFRPAPESRSVADLARHVIESGRMMCGELTRVDGDFARQSFDQHVAEYAGDVAEVADPDTLLELLRITQEQGDRELREAGEVFMLQFIRQFNGERATRFSWLHHGISHEEYHRGQLALYARLLGRVPALTQRIREAGG